jgi:hypothetical protein
MELIHAQINPLQWKTPSNASSCMNVVHASVLPPAEKGHGYGDAENPQINSDDSS